MEKIVLIFNPFFLDILFNSNARKQRPCLSSSLPFLNCVPMIIADIQGRLLSLLEEPMDANGMGAVWQAEFGLAISPPWPQTQIYYFLCKFICLQRLALTSVLLRLPFSSERQTQRSK